MKLCETSFGFITLWAKYCANISLGLDSIAAIPVLK